MKCEDVLENGVIRLPTPAQLRHQRLQVLIDIPVDAIDATASGARSPVTPPLSPRALTLMAELNAIHDAPPAPDDQPPAWSAKQEARILALTPREDR